MVKVKEMPYSEKYAKVLDTIKLDEAFVPAFIQKYLGNQAVDELSSIWGEAMRPVPEAASDKEKYEVAYSNFIWIAKSNLSFVRGRLGEDGIEKLKHAEVEALKKENAGPALFLLKVIRAVSSGSAFTMAAKQVAYQLQWISPFSVKELNKHRAVLDIPSCKILDFPDSDALCLLGCQSIYPMWLSEQFKVKMESNRQGNSCVMTFTPL